MMLWVATGLVLIALYAWYATIVTRRNRVSEALASIDVQLTQRHDLIPNVLQIARRFMDHERGLMDDITAMRAKALSRSASATSAVSAKNSPQKINSAPASADCLRSPRTIRR